MEEAAAACGGGGGRGEERATSEQGGGIFSYFMTSKTPQWLPHHGLPTLMGQKRLGARGAATFVVLVSAPTPSLGHPRSALILSFFPAAEFRRQERKDERQYCLPPGLWNLAKSGTPARACVDQPGSSELSESSLGSRIAVRVCSCTPLAVCYKHGKENLLCMCHTVKGTVAIHPNPGSTYGVAQYQHPNSRGSQEP